MKEGMRSLYQCSKAKVGLLFGLKGIYDIYCVEFHTLTRDGVPLNYYDLRDGDSLYCDTCKDCADYSEIGGKIYDKKARGWK